MTKSKKRGTRKDASSNVKPPTKANRQGAEPSYAGDEPPAKIFSRTGFKWISVVTVSAAITALFPLLYPVAANGIGRVFNHDDPIVVNVRPEKPRPPESSPSRPPETPQGGAAHRPISPNSIAQKIRTGQWNWELCLWTTPSAINNQSIRALTDIIGRDGAVTDPFFKDTRAWVYEHGGADGGVSYFRLTFQGTKHNVVINNIQADIVSRGKPQTGGMIMSKSEGAASVSQQRLNLDRPAPRVDYFANHYITIKKGESHVMELTAYTRKYFVVWNLQVDLVVDGEELSLFIDSKGTTHRSPRQGIPFRTSALLPLGKYASSYELTVDNPQAWVPLHSVNYDPSYTDALLDPTAG